MMSGGPIAKLTEGWAVKVFGFGKAHYFKRDGVGVALSLCSRSAVKAGGLRGVGSWDRCAVCTKLATTDAEDAA